MIKYCVNCLEREPDIVFSKNRKQCESCRSSQVYRTFIERKIEKSPHLYTDCSCGHIMNVKYKVCSKCKTPVKINKTITVKLK